MITRKRPRIGDVIEIPTPQGLAYAHYTHKHEAPPRYGALLGVLSGLHALRPRDFTNLVSDPPFFITFFPLGAACHRGLVFVAGSAEIPSRSQ